MGLVAIHTADKVDAGDDIAPLVATTDLQVATLLAVQREEIIGLEQHVGELRVRDAVGLQAALDRVTVEHGVEREVLAHIAQESDDGHVGRPVGVVDHLGRVLTVEVDEAAQLLLDGLEVVLDGFFGEHGALPHVTRITDKAGGTAGQCEWVVPRLLEAA